MFAAWVSRFIREFQGLEFEICSREIGQFFPRAPCYYITCNQLLFILLINAAPIFGLQGRGLQGVKL